MLKIKNLKTSVDGKEILKGVDLDVKRGELHVLMGPNGSGKSTLAQIIAGHPIYKITGGDLRFMNKDLRKLTPDMRAKMGIFLAFQQPVEVPGVSVFNVLRKAKHSIALRSPRQLGESSNASVLRPSASDTRLRRLVKTSPAAEAPRALPEFRQELKKYMAELRLPEDFLRRAINEGFSGGEKKRSEILQMLALKPKLVILDEIDSGLDVDGLKIVASSIRQFSINNKQSSIILITHYARILKYLKPDFVHVMVEGKIVKSGSYKLAKDIEEKGYNAWQTV